MKSLRKKLFKYTALGRGLKDKSVLTFLGVVASERDRSDSPRWQKLSRFIPNLWVKPGALKGLAVLIRPTDWSQTVVFDEVFLNGNYDLAQLGFIPKVILDCGAHIGLFSMLAAGAFPKAKIIAFEPNPTNADQVRKQVAANGLNVTVLESAVSVDTSERLFSALNSHSGRLVNESGPDSYRVTTTDLPAMLLKMNPSNLLIKMDIEGEEEILLPKLVPLLPQECAIFFETHSFEAGWEKISQLLSVSGFEVKRLNARGEFADGFARRCISPSAYAFQDNEAA